MLSDFECIDQSYELSLHISFCSYLCTHKGFFFKISEQFLRLGGEVKVGHAQI